MPKSLQHTLFILLPLLVIAYYMVSLGYGPLALIWTGLMMVSSGQLGIGAGLLICLLLGLAVSAVANVVAIARVPLDRTRPPSPVTVRGPVSYAGPGSLGGTASALPRPGQTVRR